MCQAFLSTEAKLYNTKRRNGSVAPVCGQPKLVDNDIVKQIMQVNGIYYLGVMITSYDVIDKK